MSRRLVAAVHLDEVDGADDAAGVADRAREPRRACPGVSSISTRIVRRYCALGVALTVLDSSVVSCWP